MPSHVTDSLIFRDFFSTDEMRAVFDDATLVQYWLDVEAALACAQAELGIIPAAAAETISHCAKADRLDLMTLRHGTNLVGYPILPLVRQLAAASGEAGRYVHWGATTQDIMDTATVLQLRAALEILVRDLELLIDNLVRLAATYRDVPMAGRTHGQHALPITFGFKVAVWVDELLRHRERLEQTRPRLLRCQFAGAAGTLASLNGRGWEVHLALAAKLDLQPAPIAWHSARDSFAEYVMICGLLTSTLGKMAHEVATLQKNEFGELEEPFESGKGSSSTMPQKRNPILCEAIAGIAQLVAQHSSTMLGAMRPEHERAMAEWHVEWDVIPHASILTAAALHQSIRVFESLVVYPEAMARNLELTNGLIAAEAVMMRLGEQIGRQTAHDHVYDACERAVISSRSLEEELAADPRVIAVISVEEIRRLLRPANYLGLAPFFVDQIINRVHVSEEQEKPMD